MGECKLCGQSLVLELHPDDFNEATSSVVGGSATVVPDDLQLPCGRHFHWQCLLDESSEIVISSKCPSCETYLIFSPLGPSAPTIHCPSWRTRDSQIITSYRNDGGIQDKLDILPLITEEAYLEDNPSARPARAFMIMCSQGDIDEIIELIHEIHDDSDVAEQISMSLADLLRYQDPLDNMQSALHLVVVNGHQEILWLLLWLLLWLASGLRDDQFPKEAIHKAQNMRIQRHWAGTDVDVRTIRNAQGQTAGMLAAQIGETWHALVDSGIL